VASGSRVTYPGALGGVDVTYDALANGVKETLVLHSAAAPSSVSFGLSLPAGASLAGQPDGGLAVRMAGATVFTLPAPSAVDSAGEPGRAAATRASYAVSGPAGSPTVTVTVPSAWLSDPARVFPVLVDPTSVGSTAAYDTYIEGGSQANANFDSAPGGQVCAGYDAATGAPARALVRFVDDALPTNVRVVSAAVHEHVLSTTGSQTLTVYPVTTAWDEFQATWNSHHTGQSWTSPGGDLGAAEDSQTLSGADPDNTWHTWTVNPAEVQTWLSDPSANKGYALRAPVETSGNLVCLQGQPATGNAPYLQVIYEPVVGLPSSATALTHALDDSAALHVNVSNGNLVLTSSDVRASAPGVPLAISRGYNSLTASAQNYMIGSGWTLTPGDTGGDYLEDNDTNTAYHSVSLGYRADGSSVYAHPTSYANLGAGTYTDPLGDNVSVTRDASDSFTVRDHATGTLTKYLGSNDHMLDSVTDRHANTEAVAYSSDVCTGVVPVLRTVTLLRPS